jgi:hypothetical protein
MNNDLWVRNILDIVQEFSSEEFQKRVWLEGKGPEVSSFIEAACGFFDDNNADELIDVQWRQVGLTEEQRNKLAHFRDALEVLNKRTPETPNDADILNDPEWPKIRQLAKDAFNAFVGSKWLLP